MSRKVISLCLNEKPPAAAMRICSLDDIDAGHHLCDRMLDLEARVRFHEIEVPAGSIRNSNVPAFEY